MVAVVILVFTLPRAMPGDPLAALDDPDNSVYVTDPAVRDKVRAYYGLDDPLPEQFQHYVGRLARGDLGYSIARKRPVASLLRAHLPWTLLPDDKFDGPFAQRVLRIEHSSGAADVPERRRERVPLVGRDVRVECRERRKDATKAVFSDDEPPSLGRRRSGREDRRHAGRDRRRADHFQKSPPIQHMCILVVNSRSVPE